MDKSTIETLHKICDQYYRKPSGEVLGKLIESFQISEEQRQAIHTFAEKLVIEVRGGNYEKGPFFDLMHKYDLSSEEGLALMCLAESILRVPDKENITALIQDKVGHVDWLAHMEEGDSWLVRMSARGLSVTEKLLGFRENRENGFLGLLGHMSMPAIRKAMREGMKVMAKQFVMAEDIQEAIKKMKGASSKRPYTYSFDMLGEAARTESMADKYFDAYLEAIQELKGAAKSENPYDNPGISIKLSALHPRYAYQKRTILLKELVPKVQKLCQEAKKANLNLTIDAEEADRLDISLLVLEGTLSDSSLRGWSGFGLAVQAYQKRSSIVVDWAIAMAQRYKQKIGVRLVKGAYWDAEIKQAQVGGLSGYPVFTRKSATDISYLICAQKLLAHKNYVYPQFATHNAYSVSAILEMDPSHEGYEFQRLFGMGGGVYEALWQHFGIKNALCRIYAPVGKHKDLLAYLVRRLLENGANTSFVNKIGKKHIKTADLIKDPFVEFAEGQSVTHSKIVLPSDLFMPGRQNSQGVDLSNMTAQKAFLTRVKESQKDRPWSIASIIDGMTLEGSDVYNTTSPQHYVERVAHVQTCDEDTLLKALNVAHEGASSWRMMDVDVRANCLEKAADLLQERLHIFVGILVIEGGKTIEDAIDEVREAIDFCLYYAMMARKMMETPQEMPGPTGEKNQLYFEGRGVFLSISPWNFPLAIFMGQVVAALVAGNTVVAKPAETTPVVAERAVRLLHEAGIPTNALQFICASGKMVSKVLVANNRVDGVVFTGSTGTAHKINQALAARQNGPIVPFIAETGGINTMIVDSTALPEQVVDAVVKSAFRSAGQRCSALRLIYIQEDVADDIIEMIKGAMAELTLGDPVDLETDVGPVITHDVRKELQEYVDTIDARGGKILYACNRQRTLPNGSFMMPHLIEICRGQDLKEEQFGPILHVVRFSSDSLDEIINEINNSGYGLTLGIQTRIQQKAQYISKRVRVGNIYVNRDIIGAVVGVQPFGGQGLSGTGPKAGGPHYLTRFMTEKTYTEDTTAAGGNASLLNISLE